MRTPLTDRPRVLSVDTTVPESPAYRLKRRLLGPPLTTRQLQHERLSNPLALGVLSSDCISSSAYGTEEMLLVLLPVFGLAAFTILLPLTAVILVVLLLVTLSYRSVVMVYTRAGGSYVVARENFGPPVAQIAAVALMLDYIVTVAVQAAAGTAALVSAAPALSSLNLEITVGVVAVLFYGNLRGLREAGRAFALPTYLFAGSMAVVIVAGIVRVVFGDLPHYNVHVAGAVRVGSGEGLLSAAAIFVLLRAFANGGSSLTGLEAVSNGVSAFRRPEGRNARTTLVVMSCILGSLVLGVSWLAHLTHAVPYETGTPTVISQVAKAVFSGWPGGHVLFLIVQLATMLILYTGANTPFNGFPYLASFVAEDSFLPRQLTKRGHRLAFSNGIIVLGVLSVALLIGTGAHVDKLVAFYAIGVFTGFTLAGFGMAKHFATERGPKWQGNVAINALAGGLSLLVVLIFAVVKFTEGAWLVVVIFPIAVLGLTRLNRQYQAEARALEMAPAAAAQPNFARHSIVVLVDSLDVATVRAVRYARTLKPTELRAVHFMIDSAHAQQLQTDWDDHPAVGIALETIDCPDRRLTRAAVELTARLTADEQTEVTVLLPRRIYSRLLGRLLHDRTADEIADVVGRLRHVAATIVPFNVRSALRHTGDASAQGATLAPAPANGTTPASAGKRRSAHREAALVSQARAAAARNGTTPIGDVTWRQRATVEGSVRAVRVTPLSDSPSLECEVVDSTGGLAVLFYGRRKIAGIEPGTRIRLEGMVGDFDGNLAMANPMYELLPN
jgi:amino acid transporter